MPLIFYAVLCYKKAFTLWKGNYSLNETAINRIKEYDPSYEQPEIKTGGCYVATAVYGSYDCPQVWTLRRFRDFTLAKTWFGRAFIRTYYAISPTLVKWFGKTAWFKGMWKPTLDKMVAKLQEDFSMPFPQDEGKTLSTAQDFYHYIKKVQSDESV